MDMQQISGLLVNANGKRELKIHWNLDKNFIQSKVEGHLQREPLLSFTLLSLSIVSQTSQRLLTD